MPRFNRAPDGYQGLLDSQTLGRRPSETTEQVIPTVSIDRFLAANLIRVAVNSAAFNSIGDSVGLFVPTGQFWQLVSISSICTATGVPLNAKINVGHSLTLADNDTGVLRTHYLQQNNVPGSTNFNISGSATASKVYGPQLAPYQIVIPPGSIVTAHCIDLDLNGGTEFTNTVNCAFIRLDA